MKSLLEQLSNKCIHFTGIMNETCKVGIKYSDVRSIEKPYKFPCLNQGGSCSKCQFPSQEETEQTISELAFETGKILNARAKIVEDHNATKQFFGKVKCDCGGEISYAIAEVNGHIRALCSTCKLSFME